MSCKGILSLVLTTLWGVDVTNTTNLETKRQRLRGVTGLAKSHSKEDVELGSSQVWCSFPPSRTVSLAINPSLWVSVSFALFLYFSFTVTLRLIRPMLPLRVAVVCQQRSKDAFLGIVGLPWHSPLGQGVVKFSPQLGWQDRLPHGVLAAAAQAVHMEGSCGKIQEASQTRNQDLQQAFSPGYVSDLRNVLVNLLLC